MIGGILLVAGTATGAGMLALPTSTGLSGLLPSIIIFVLYSLFMTFTALLMLEVNLWVGEGNNLISMAKLTLGKWGEAVSWIVYLFLLYSLTTAYIAGGAPLLLHAFKYVTGIQVPEWVGPFPLLLIFGFFVFRGAHSVDRINRYLMMGMVVSFVLLIIFLFPFIKIDLLTYIDWQYTFLGISIVSTSFGFHIVIPSLVTYMKRDIVSLRKVIIIGSSIPLFVYIVWEILTLGIIPIDGLYGIRYGQSHSGNAATLLMQFIHHPLMSILIQLFSFFAIITSFLGVSLSLFDFLADGLHIKKTRNGRLLLFSLSFLPPLIITTIDPNTFLLALEYAGAFGVVVLLGLLPPLMTWSGRYRLFLITENGYQVSGGKTSLIITLILSLSIIGFEIVKKLGLL